MKPNVAYFKLCFRSGGGSDAEGALGPPVKAQKVAFHFVYPRNLHWQDSIATHSVPGRIYLALALMRPNVCARVTDSFLCVSPRYMSQQEKVEML